MIFLYYYFCVHNNGYFSNFYVYNIHCTCTCIINFGYVICSTIPHLFLCLCLSFSHTFPLLPPSSLSPDLWRVQSNQSQVVWKAKHYWRADWDQRIHQDHTRGTVPIIHTHCMLIIHWLYKILMDTLNHVASDFWGNTCTCNCLSTCTVHVTFRH